MLKEEIITRVKDIMIDIFDVKELNINEDTTVDDVEEWDSITHIALVASIENEFKIKFTMNEIVHLKNVGELIQLINKNTTIRNI